jgi:hypothetical protein
MEGLTCMPNVDEKWEENRQICCDVKRKTRIGRGNKMCDKLRGTFRWKVGVEVGMNG